MVNGSVYTVRARAGGCSNTGKFQKPGGDGGDTGDRATEGDDQADDRADLDATERALDALAWAGEGFPFVDAGDAWGLDRKRRVLRALEALPEAGALDLLHGLENRGALVAFTLEFDRLGREEMRSNG